MTCRTHGTALMVRHFGSMWMEDFELYCPQCEAERKERKEAYEAENGYWLEMVRKAEKMERQLGCLRPFDGFLERYGPEKYNKWFEKFIPKFF